MQSMETSSNTWLAGQALFSPSVFLKYPGAHSHFVAATLLVTVFSGHSRHMSSGSSALL